MTGSVLLTGGAGYIGSHTLVALIEAGYRVVVLDDFSNSSRGVLGRLATLTGQEEILCYEGSVLDRALLAKIFASESIGSVIHFAGKKAVSESTFTPIDYFDSNIAGLINLLQAMKDAGVFNLVFSSSATVYGHATSIPTPENSPLHFTNPYAFTKVACEQMLLQACQSDPWNVGVLRYFNPVGAHHSGLIGEDPKGTPNNLMPIIAKVACGKLPKVQVLGTDYPTKDGSGERDYIHVMDLARGHLLSLEKILSSGMGHVVNLGTGTSVSVLEMISAYEAASGQEIPYETAPRRPGDVAVSRADVTRAKSVLGFTAKFGLEEMCQSSWRWMTSEHACKPALETLQDG